MKRAPALVSALALATAQSIAAQVVTLHLGGFRATYGDSLRGTAASAGADVAWNGARASGIVGASLAEFTQGGWAAQGYGTFAGRLATSARQQLALNAETVGYRFEGGSWAGTATGGPSAAGNLGPFVASVVLAAGGVRRLDGPEDLLLSGTVRLHRTVGPWSIEGWAAAARGGARRYSDLAAGLRREWSGASLEAVGGGRFGDLGDEAWARVRAALRLSTQVWLEAGAGRYPPDATGFLHGNFAQLGLKVPLRRGPAVAMEPVPTVRRESDNAVTVRFVVADTGRMSIAGEWTEWRAVPLEAAGRSAWLLKARLAPGVYRFSLVSEDGRWIVPRGVATVEDDFGGTAGLLVVPS